jgi:hypothetical protein
LALLVLDREISPFYSSTHLTVHLVFIRAIWLFVEKITVEFIGTGATTAANLQVPTTTTFSVVGSKVPQLIKNGRFFPYLLDPLGSHISRGQLEITARLGNAPVGDKHETLARKAPRTFRGIALLFHNPVIVGSTGYFHLHFILGFDIVQPVEDILVCLSGQFLALQTLSATDRDKEKHMPGDSPDGLNEVIDILEVIHIEAGHGSIYLKRKAYVAKDLCRSQHCIERAVNATKPVVQFPCLFVKAETDPFDPTFLQAYGRFMGEQGTIDGDDHPETLGISVFDDFENVVPHERFSTGEDDRRKGEACYLIDYGMAFRQGQLTLIRAL